MCHGASVAAMSREPGDREVELYEQLLSRGPPFSAMPNREKDKPERERRSKIADAASQILLACCLHLPTCRAKSCIDH